jgi:hypothetical protein
VKDVTNTLGTVVSGKKHPHNVTPVETVEMGFVYNKAKKKTPS